jgi:outer membrane murein-binding lipoprotein Lpp
MNIVEVAYLAPAQCLFTGSAEGPFIDLHREFGFEHAGRMYIKTSFARELGTFAGLPSADAVEALEARVQELEAENEQLADEVESLREFEQAATYTVEHMGQKVKRRPGPKPKNPAASAA